jgi:hypothetical protein
MDFFSTSHDITMCLLLPHLTSLLIYVSTSECANYGIVWRMVPGWDNVQGVFRWLWKILGDSEAKTWKVSFISFSMLMSSCLHMNKLILCPHEGTRSSSWSMGSGDCRLNTPWLARDWRRTILLSWSSNISSSFFSNAVELKQRRSVSPCLLNYTCNILLPCCCLTELDVLWNASLQKHDVYLAFKII